ncbi:MAG TPA: DUF2336 domain-containing protein [Pseudolabrys sp.]|nr:DUF2336 domain-containing protein [Pseudolabrys sp.]
MANQNGLPGSMGAPLELIQELDSSITHSTDQRRSVMLRHLTDLYLVGSEQYSEDEIDLIDDVFVRLVSTIEQSARALLAIRLGPVMVAPPKILRLLACDDAIEVASPVLTQAARLDTDTLIECARTKNQEHLLAISRRKTLPEALTDVLVERGDQQVVLSTAKNAGARFSGKGFDTLIKRSCGDDALTSCVGVRSDLPPQLLEQLLAAASEKVRTKLMAEREYAKADIERAVDDVAGQIQAGAAGQPLSYAAAQVLVESLHQAGLLTTGKLQEFALAGRFEETVAALSVMSNVPTVVIEENMRDTRAEALLVLARANGLSWETTRSIMMLAAKRHRRSTTGIDQTMPAFFRLRQSTAQQILDFHRMPPRPARRH